MFGNCSENFNMVERGQVKKILRVVLFCILLIVYYVMYMHTALKEYYKYKESTTMAQTRENKSHLNSPVFVACPNPPFKTSFFREIGFNKSGSIDRFLWVSPYWQNKFRNTTSTAEVMYMNMSYHLGLDWQIAILSSPDG